MTRYFVDCEFIEDGKTIDLISIGIVTDDGREYYAISQDCDTSKASDWVRNNVLNQLGDPATVRYKQRAHIAADLIQFVRTDNDKPEFWGYYADYDWVVICQLFGTMMQLPSGWPKYCRDLKQWCDQLGNPRLPEQDMTEHNALSDARWNKTAYEFLTHYAATYHSRDT